MLRGGGVAHSLTRLMRCTDTGTVSVRAMHAVAQCTILGPNRLTKMRLYSHPQMVNIYNIVV